MTNNVTRRDFLINQRKKADSLKNVKSDWPTKRVAKLYRQFLEDKPAPYYTPLKEYTPVPITPSKRHMTVDWNEDAAAHLLRRTLFAPTFSEITSTGVDTMENTVSTLLATQNQPDPPGDWVTEPPPQFDTLTEEEIMELIETYYYRHFQLIGWWMKRMATQPMSIVENLSLFWHDHFATSFDGVFFPQAMYQQNSVFREHCLGNFRELLRRISFGPAMMIWLNTNSNRVNHPNENFSRELLELFTIGVDNYTQTDVEEAARSFTGYVTNGVNTNYNYNQATGYGSYWQQRHDFGQKTFLGQTGNFDGDDIIDIILQQDQTALFICEKIYKWFVYEVPDETFVNEMATIFRNSNYEILPVMEYMLSSDHFYNENYRGCMIRNPLTVTQGIFRQFDIADENMPLHYLIDLQYFMGMIPNMPPDVNGWIGYRSWLNSITLPIRKLFASSMTDGSNLFGGNFDFQPDVIAFAQTLSNPNDAEAIVRDFAKLFFPLPISEALETQLLDALLDGAAVYDWDISNAGAAHRLRNLIKYMIRKPEFQLI